MKASADLHPYKMLKSGISSTEAFELGPTEARRTRVDLRAEDPVLLSLGSWLQETRRFFSLHGGSNSYSKGLFGGLSWFVLVSFLQTSECFLQLKIDVYVGRLPPPC